MNESFSQNRLSFSKLMYLLSLKIDDGVLSSVFEEVFVGGDAVVGQDLGETVGAAGVHQVGQELQI